MEAKANKIAVIGLGKLGACLAAILAHKGYLVEGGDISKSVVDKINNKQSPCEETGLSDLLQRTAGRLTATTDIKGAASRADIIFIVVPTPSKKNGSFALTYLIKAAASIGKGMRSNANKFPLIVITSTVLPRDTEASIRPVLEAFSKRKCGKGFGLCYSPEFIALGSVIHDMKNPDMILIGEHDERSGDLLEKVYGNMVENKPAIQRMNIVNAEIVKLSVNSFITTKISFANVLSEICHRTIGANIDTVVTAIGKDSRIGSKYLKGGTPYGGPCFPRDNRAFVKMAKDRGINAKVADATDHINQQHLKFIFNLIKGISKAKQTIGLLGLSYKPGTFVIEESAGIKLANMLIKSGYSVIGYDQNAKEMIRLYPLNFKLSDSLEKCTHKSEVVVLLSDDTRFKKLAMEDFKMKPYIIDCWRVLDAKTWSSYKRLISLGIGNRD